MQKYLFKIFTWSPRVVFFIFAGVCLERYITYLMAVVPFAYDWGPSDGDHLNFAHRLAQGLPIYMAFKEGHVLSIYNPLFHGLIALLGGANATLSFARLISFLFWLLTPLTVLLYFRKQWGYFYAVLAALFIWLPPEPEMLIDIMYVGGNTLMAFLFTITLLYAASCSKNSNTSFWSYFFIGFLTAFCFLAKQQGIIVLAIIISFMILRRIDFRNILLIFLGFSFVIVVSTAYLEFLNTGQYLHSTLIDLSGIMSSSGPLARARLSSFLFVSNMCFLICILVSFLFFIFIDRDFKKISIWQISFIIHIPFLLVILGNGGGGPNYLLTMWISMVLLCIETITKVERLTCPPLGVLTFIVNNKYKHKSYLSRIPEEYIAIFKQKYWYIVSNTLLLGLLINSSIGTKTIIGNIESIKLPTPHLNELMQDYQSSISKLVAGKSDLNVLTNRNIGALVANNLNIKNEGATMFSYAWNYPSAFDKQTVLNDIREKKFDMITTGLQEYPEDVKKEIANYYQPIMTKDVNLIYGIVGPVTVFIPKVSIHG